MFDIGHLRIGQRVLMGLERIGGGNFGLITRRITVKAVRPSGQAVRPVRCPFDHLYSTHIHIRPHDQTQRSALRDPHKPTYIERIYYDTSTTQYPIHPHHHP
jgi:hypothetical protein